MFIMILEKKTLTPGKIATYCDVNLRTVTRWVAQGHLKAFKLPGRGNNRITLSDFLEFLNRHGMPIPEDLQNPTRRILIAEDDRNMALSIERTLTMAGFETAIATDGFQAGILLGTFSPQLLTLDLNMARTNGFEVLKLIRKTSHLAGVKILIVSGLPKTVLAQTLEQGAHAFLSKPFQGDELLAKVNGLIGMPRSKEFL
jgi:excisionase family DNA binding protein